ncbi:MAG: FHA domain-containing protein [bacterium]|nr:FHA domain-containing protein [Gammaproteobacteria bacterium]HIL97847.1 FHA domain-containing protein [Pseudomonadales bacterium]
MIKTTLNRQVAKIQLDNGISFVVYENSLPLLIGRDPGCGICIPADNVSRHHCELYLDDIDLCLRDLSTAGTVVGSKKFRGGTISIQSTTKVQLAPQTVMTITPFELIDKTMLEQATDPNQQLTDRRRFTRRTRIVAVDIERRSVQPRRVNIRRARERTAVQVR